MQTSEYSLHDTYKEEVTIQQRMSIFASCHTDGQRPTVSIKLSNREIGKLSGHI